MLNINKKNPNSQGQNLVVTLKLYVLVFLKTLYLIC